MEKKKVQCLLNNLVDNTPVYHGPNYFIIYMLYNV